MKNLIIMMLMLVSMGCENSASENAKQRAGAKIYCEKFCGGPEKLSTISYPEQMGGRIRFSCNCLP